MEMKRKTPRTPEPVEDIDIDKIREHFRKETSKLDNWIYHHRIDHYFKPETKKEDTEK
jgi:hypothetical protein